MPMVTVKYGIDKAKSRYEDSVKNGKKGGRPKKYSDEALIDALNKTNGNVAEAVKIVGCGLSTMKTAKRDLW